VGRLEILERSRKKGDVIRPGGLLLHCHHKFRWEAVDHFEDYGHMPLPQPPSHKQMGLSPQDPAEVSVSCNTWVESMAGMAGYGRNTALGNQFQMVLMASQDASRFPLG
jgi:hypothetical protein